VKRTVKQRQNDAQSRAGLQGSLDGKALKVGVVCARFNRDITAKLEAGAMRRLKELGVADKNVRLVSVPGAVEIPLAAKALLKAGMDGVITLGCVIRGETTHYESVCTSVERGCTHLQLEQLKPVVFGVLTVENMEQALDRVGGHHGHKGEEAAEVAVEMCNLLKVIKKRK